MDKLAILELEGDLKEVGFKVTLEIYAEVGYYKTRVKGRLPPDEKLLEQLEKHWLDLYRRIGSPYRIKPSKRIYDGLGDRIKKCRTSGTQLCELFQSWLNTEGFSSVDKRLREELSRKDNVRFVIRTNDSKIQKLPWHFWDFFERYPRAEVAFSSINSESLLYKRVASTWKVKILAILGHREGIDVDRDRRVLENLPNTDVTFLVEPKHYEINDRLWDCPWDIIFFAGHSETEGDTGRIYINPSDSLTVEELWYSLKKSIERGLQCAIFNSCDGLGLANRLNNLNIPQIVLMRELVPDRVAQEFLKYFLHCFAIENKPFYLAVREARERLQGLESNFPCASWLPVIYQNPTEIPLTWQELLGAKKSLSTQKVISVLGKVMFSDLFALFKRPEISDQLKREIHIYQGNYIEKHDGGISHKHDSQSEDNTNPS